MSAALFLVLAGSALWTPAATPEVALLPPLVLGVGDADAQSALAVRVTEASRKVLAGARILPVVATCDPLVEARCLAAQLEAHAGIEVAAQISVERGAHAWLLRLRVFGKDGQVVDERRVPTDAEDVARATQDVLVAAFDAGRHTGRIQLIGAGDGAVRVDGQPVAVRRSGATGNSADGVIDDVRTGRHTVEVDGAFGSTQKFTVEVEFDRTTELAVGELPPPTTATDASAPSSAPSHASASASAAATPSASAPVAPGIPLGPFAVGAVVTGLFGSVGGGLLWIVAEGNREEWRRRATGRTFPRNTDDPLCAASGCLSAGGEQVGWTQGYGPLGESEQIGQGARFMMVAFSRDNELRWRDSQNLAGTVAVASSILVVASSVTLVLLAVDDNDEIANVDAQ